MTGMSWTITVKAYFPYACHDCLLSIVFLIRKFVKKLSQKVDSIHHVFLKGNVCKNKSILPLLYTIGWIVIFIICDIYFAKFINIYSFLNNDIEFIPFLVWIMPVPNWNAFKSYGNVTINKCCPVCRSLQIKHLLGYL